MHLDKHSDNSQRSSSCKIWFEGVWERNECIITSNPNFEEELKLGITPDESFGKISQPNKTNHKCLDSETGMKVKDCNQVSNLLQENKN